MTMTMMMKNKSKKLDNKIGYISASRCGSYNNCKFKFYSEVVVNKKDQYNGDNEDDGFSDAIYLSFGKAMHKTLELFHKNGCTKKSELRSLFRSAYIDYGVNDGDYHTLGIEMCETYWSYLKYIAPKRVLVATEVFFDIVLGKKNGEDIHAKGTIDAVFYLGNGIYEIVDYKTNAWLPSKDEFEANLQIALYDIALRDESMRRIWYKGISPKAVLLTMHFLRFEPTNGVMQTEIDDYLRCLNKMYFIDTYIQMNSKPKAYFVCNINNLCPYCQYNDKCPDYIRVLDADEDDDYFKYTASIAKFDDSDFAESVAAINRYKGMVKILESEIEELNGRCSDYIKRTDSDIIVGDKKYYLGNSSQRYLLPYVTISILKKYELWDEKEFISRIPIGKIEYLKKQKPDVWAEIERKALKRSNGTAVIKTEKVPKGLLKARKKNIR